MNDDSRSQLEREFDDPDHKRLTKDQLAKLIFILKAERNAFRYSFKVSEEDRVGLLAKIRALEGEIKILVKEETK